MQKKERSQTILQTQIDNIIDKSFCSKILSFGVLFSYLTFMQNYSSNNNSNN